MKLLKLLNPQGWLGQIILLALIIGGSFTYGLYVGTKNCPPTTQVQIDQKNKAKKGAHLTNSVTGIGSYQNCEEWLKSLDMKEVRKIRK